MSQFVQIETPEAGIARIVLSRPPVNAINAAVIRELRSTLDSLSNDNETRAIVLTGQGAFFSFGLDVPEIFPLSPEEFTAFLQDFTALYREIFAARKPVIAALNGHATAGGCMIAIACDARVMAHGKAKIGLNEVRFGAGLFAGTAILLRHLLGGKSAELVSHLGAFYSAEQAAEFGLVDMACPVEEVQARALEKARECLVCDPAALAQIRQTTRAGTLAQFEAEETESIRTFVELWYSPQTRAQVEKIAILDK